MTNEVAALRERAQGILARARDEGRDLSPSESAECQRLIDEAKLAIEVNKMGSALGGEPGYPSRGLATAVMNQGFDRKSNPSVVVDFDSAKFGAVASFDGTFEDSNRRIVVAPSLGADQRFMWTSLPTTPLALGETGIQSFRQKSRTLAASSSMIRDVGAVTAKPETSTETEIVTAPAKQIANVQTGLPNVLVDNQQFRAYLDFDVRLAYNEAVDHMVFTEIAASSPTGTFGGANFVENALYAAEDVRGAGYTPDVIVLSPTDSLAFALTQLTGGDTYIRTPNIGLRLVTAKNLADDAGFVLDTQAAGQLYLSPAVLALFEENAGKTNSSTLRFESNGLYVVQRADAIAAVGSAGS